MRDASRSALAKNDSPDVGFDVSINPYRGCEHGCVYCYARPTHEYLGYSAGLDFETKILVKHELPELLRAALSRRELEAAVDRDLGRDRRVPADRAEAAAHAALPRGAGGLPQSLLDHHQEPARRARRGRAAGARPTRGGVGHDLAHDARPRARAARWSRAPRSRTRGSRRSRQLARAGVPVGVNLAPIVPGLTDHEIPALAEAAADAGARGRAGSCCACPTP